MKKTLMLFYSITVILLFCSVAAAGPYAPAPPDPSSTAIHMDDSAFVAWASGWENYVKGTNVNAQWQTPEEALGKAQGTSGDVVVLGQGGEITMTFVNPIIDASGYDFAVFENSFSDTFLELGYVEVSSNGTDFFRFDNDSLTLSSVDSFGAVDPTNIDGFGGKYRQGFGTPFDLASLTVNSLLDINNIGYVKVVDIVGDGTYLDTSGDVIYDPYPTTGSAGFDLDAVGVINAVPIPGAVWLLGSGLLGLVYFRRRKTTS